MKYLSLFSGIGGFELGIQLAYAILNNRPTGEEKQTCEVDKNCSNTSCEHSWEPPTCIGYSEIDKYATATYQSHFPEHKNYGDITKINEQELPDFDMLVGGFPCQAFSIAGKRKGFEDTRGTLFFDIARIIKAKQPRLVFLENVKGLLSHDNGETFRTIIATLDELGYDLQWQVLNSKNHGVPQNRERVFIIGHLRGTSRPKVFPFRGTNAKSVIKDTTVVADFRYDEGLRIRPEPISPCLTSTQKENTISACPLIVKVSGDLEKRKTYLGDIASTLASNPTSDNTARLFENGKIRRLTPIECERLQGFPDNWTIGSDTQRYKQCGNAVTVNVIRDIAERLLTPPTKP